MRLFVLQIGDVLLHLVYRQLLSIHVLAVCLDGCRSLLRVLPF